MLLEKEEQRERVDSQVRKLWGPPMGRGWERRVGGGPPRPSSQASPLVTGGGLEVKVDAGLSLYDSLEGNLSSFSI